MVAMVLATLILSGLTSLALAQNAADSQTRKELVHEAQALATTFEREAVTANGSDPAKALRTLLLALRAPLRLDGSAVVGLRPLTGTLFQPAAPRQAPALPAGLRAADLDPTALSQDETVSGRAGSVVFAAVPFSTEIQLGAVPRRVTLVIVLSRRAPSSLATAGPWFAVSALVILAVAGLVAYRLGRRFVAPVRAAQEVTSRIAAGDLDARVPAPPGTDPELAGLAESVNAMAANLAQAKGAERQFLQSVSHELRTPLTSIRGFAEAIEDGATADATAAAAVIASWATCWDWRRSRPAASRCTSNRSSCQRHCRQRQAPSRRPPASSASRSPSRAAIRCGWRPTPTASPRSSPTSWRTLCATPGRRWPCRRRPARKGRGWRCPTTARGSLLPTCPTCSTACSSPAASPSATGRRLLGVPAWAWRSSPSWLRRWAAR